MTLNDRTWMLSGKCLNLHPDTMFPENDEALAAAKRICRDCPVIAQCAAWARKHRVGVGGVWAGKPRNDGHKVRDYDACGTPRGFGRHVRWGETPCEGCLAAQRVRWAELREINADRRNAQRRTYPELEEQEERGGVNDATTTPHPCPNCSGDGGFKVDSWILYGIPGGEDWGEMCQSCKGTGVADDKRGAT